MRAKAGIFSIICLLLLVGTAAGHLPDNSTIITSNPWVIANGADQATITVMVSNLSSGSIQGANVIFTIENPIYGTLSPAIAISDATGKATSTFKVKTKSGFAVISASITTPDGYTVVKTIDQNIDHDSPYLPYFSHPVSGTVATEVPFNISITDRWGNQIDDRRGPHTITLHVHGPAPDDCGFAEAGYNHTLSRTLDANGNISALVKLTTKTGPNNILMDAFESIPDKLEWIDANTNGIPFSMTQVYSPSGTLPTLPADGTSFFTIVYTLYDKYGNPTNGQSIWVNTSVPGEEMKFLSNNLGQVVVQYGPRSSIGIINITATAVANSTWVTRSQDVKFMNTGASIISLTANPDTMASHDANPILMSDIFATVADQSGNAVAGESVIFAIDSITYEAAYNVTSPPILVSPGNITDIHGIAAVQFIPGSFTTAENPGYNASATGHCNIIATWNGTQKTVPVTWKNYPYLSVKTSVTPLTVEINNTIDVTIEFRGDGWAMHPKPIDVILLLDQSGSMGDANTPGTRLYQAKQAAKVFVDQMNSASGDRVGIISYNQSAWLYQDLTNNLDTAKNKISSINGNTNGAHTNMRRGLYEALKQETLSASPGSVRAVIHMTDGDWSMGGDPLARQGSTGFDVDGPGLHSVWAGNVLDIIDIYQYFPDIGGGVYHSGSIANAPDGQKYDDGKTNWNNDQYETTQRRATRTTTYYTDAWTSNQNMSVYAANNKIRLYSLSFVQVPRTNTKNALINMANSTGAFYQHAPDQAALETLYKQIAEDLKDKAGVNTTMTVDFENVNVTGVTMPGSEVFDYVYDPVASTKINWQNGTTTVPALDQSADWAADNKLDFTIGTIKVGQYWNATFRLRVNQSGMIDVFGRNSTVTFNGGNETLKLPQTFITVVPKLNTTVIGANTIALSNLFITEPGEIKALLPIMWNSTYKGNMTLTENVYYSIDNGPWVLFDTKTHLYPFGANITTTEYVDYAQLDVNKLPPGGYKIKIYATAPDAPDAVAETDYKTVGGQGKIFLKLE